MVEPSAEVSFCTSAEDKSILLPSSVVTAETEPSAEVSSSADSSLVTSSSTSMVSNCSRVEDSLSESLALSSGPDRFSGLSLPLPDLPAMTATETVTRTTAMVMISAITLFSIRNFLIWFICPSLSLNRFPVKLSSFYDGIHFAIKEKELPCIPEILYSICRIAERNIIEIKINTMENRNTTHGPFRI